MQNKSNKGLRVLQVDGSLLGVRGKIHIELLACHIC